MKRRRTDNPFCEDTTIRAVRVGGGRCLAPPELKESYSQAGEELKTYLVQLLVESKIHASEVCKISYLHERSGGCGCEAFGYESVDHSNRHLESVLAKIYRVPNNYYVACPFYCKKSQTRSSTHIPVQLAHEVFNDEFSYLHAVDDGGDDHVDKDRLWQNSYEKHKVVTHWLSIGKKRALIRPAALYWDGAQFNKKEGFLLFYYVDLRTGIRFLAFSIRTSKQFKKHCETYKLFLVKLLL